MYSLVEWIDEQKYSVIPLSRVKEPRKAYEDYNIGDIVRASCPGFSGVHNAKLIAIRGNSTEDKKALERLAIEHVEVLDQQKDNSAARPLDEQQSNGTTAGTQKNVSKDKPEKRRKKTTDTKSPKKAKSQEDKENKEEIKEQRQKKREEQHKQREIQLKKNQAFLSSLDAFKDTVTNNSTAVIQEGVSTYTDLDNQLITPVSSASQSVAPQPSTLQNSNQTSAANQNWTPQSTSNCNFTLQPSTYHSWTHQSTSNHNWTPQSSSIHNLTPQTTLQQQNWTPHSTSQQQNWTPQSTSHQSWHQQPPSYNNWSQQPTSHSNWTPQSTSNHNWNHQPLTNQNRPEQHLTHQNWTMQSTTHQNCTPGQHNTDYRDLSASSEPDITKNSSEKDNTVRRQIFPTDETHEYQTCQRCSLLEEQLKEAKEELSEAQSKIQQLLQGKHIADTDSPYQQQTDGRPRAGVLSPAVANANHMIELMPNSYVYLYPKDLRIASKKPSGCRKARFLLSAFYSNEELVSAGNLTGANDKKGLDKRVVQAILDYAIIKGDDKLGDLKIALRNKISALVFATQRKQQKINQL